LEGQQLGEVLEHQLQGFGEIVLHLSWRLGENFEKKKDDAFVAIIGLL